MDANRFDSFVRGFSRVISRRNAVAGALAASLPSLQDLVDPNGAKAKTKRKKKCKAAKGKKKCGKKCISLNQCCGGCGPGQQCCNGACISNAQCCADCGQGRKCCNGACISADQCCDCKNGEQCCNGACVALAECCGGCGTGQQCCNGACISTAICCECSEAKCCGGVCKNLENDPVNCGQCEFACPSGECIHGACTCENVGQCLGAGCTCRAGTGICFKGDGGGACDSDADCPLGSVCVGAFAGFVCTTPCQ